MEVGVKRKTVRGYFDLDYVVLIDIPVREGKFGSVIAVDPAVLERQIARELILQRVPLRGKEITFLRKVIGLSLEKFGNAVGYTGSGVLKWEKDPERRLDKLGEAAMRSFFAEKLGVQISGWFNELVGSKNSPEKLEVNARDLAA
jgi:DNA-binding transcriptional regulator YiaG